MSLNNRINSNFIQIAVADANADVWGINVSSNSNIFIGGGANGQVLTTDGTGNLRWTPGGSANVVPVPTVEWTATVGGNNQTFTNTVLAAYQSNDTLMDVFINGVKQKLADYSLSGNTLTLSTPLSIGDEISVGSSITGGNYTVSPTVPGGVNTELQFNNGGAFEGAPTVTYDFANSVVSLGSNSAVSISGGNVGEVLTTDGAGNLSWTAAGGNVTWDSVANIAVGDILVGSYGPTPAGSVITPGVGWTERSSGGFAQSINSVIHTGSQYVAVAENGTAFTSPDGITWTQRTTGTFETLNSVVYNGSQYVCVGTSGVILTSADGITWTQQISGTGLGLYSVAWDGTQYVAVGDSGIIITSPNGTTWTQQPSSYGQTFYGVAYGAGQWAATGGAVFGAEIYTSPDGINWTQAFIIPVTGFCRSIVYAAGKWVAVGGDFTTSVVFTSPDGVTWTQRSHPSASPINSIIWDGTQYFTVQQDGTTSVSPDGITWTLRYTNIDRSLNSVVYAGGQYVVVGMNGTIQTSPDGQASLRIYNDNINSVNAPLGSYRSLGVVAMSPVLMNLWVRVA